MHEAGPSLGAVGVDMCLATRWEEAWELAVGIDEGNLRGRN